MVVDCLIVKNISKSVNDAVKCFAIIACMSLAFAGRVGKKTLQRRKFNGDKRNE